MVKKMYVINNDIEGQVYKIDDGEEETEDFDEEEDFEETDDEESEDEDFEDDDFEEDEE